MNEEIQTEIWQVDVGAQIYEADFKELTQWVAEGSLLPEDKVRKGNLRWIEARKVPTLTPHFNAKLNGTPPPIVVTVTDAAVADATQPAEIPVVPLVETRIIEQQSEIVLPLASADPPIQKSPDICNVHSDLPSAYLCASCGGSFCRACPSSYGGSVRICPVCGGLCKTKGEIQAAKEKENTHQAAMRKGFGFEDLSNAFAYPTKFGTSLVFGAVMFMLFSLGQSATAVGGIFMIVAAIFSFMLANMLTFGILSHTVDNFSQGRIGGNFMPSFEDFSLWDDVVHPFFLSVGVYISSFGVFILIAAIGTYMVMSSLSAQTDAMKTEIEKLPGTHYYDVQKTVQQSDQVKKLLGNVAEQNDQRLKAQEEIESANKPPPAAGTEDEVMRANDLIQKSRKAELESTFGKTPETKAQEQNELVRGFMSLAAPLVVLAAIAFIWGLVYFPAACAVAGYTRSFFSTINPLVGLDTIKRLGFDYAKILIMGFLILIVSGVVGMVLNLIFSAFDIPGFGNLPAKAVGSLFGFYLWVVFSCIIGFALYKASDRLKLHR